jgi:hypothetical protein
MEPLLIPLTILGAVLAAVLALAYLNHRWEQQRTEALRNVADELGFEFHPGGDPILEGWLAKFHLFSQGHSRKLTNVLRGRTRDLDAAVFDYKYTVGSGKNARTFRTSVVCFRSDDLDLPEFALRPEDFWQRIGVKVFGYQDINFDSHPVFSRAFLLRGPDEAAVRELFTDTVLSHFETQPGVSVEGAGTTLLFYRHNKRIEPTDVRSFLTDGFAVLGMFRN